MTIPVGGEIGEEIHHVDQHLVFTSGTAKAIVGGEEKEIKAGDLVIVPQGTKHNCRVFLRQQWKMKLITTGSHQYGSYLSLSFYCICSGRACRDNCQPNKGGRG